MKERGNKLLFSDEQSPSWLDLFNTVITLIFLFLTFLFLFTDFSAALIMIFWYLLVISLNYFYPKTEFYAKHAKGFYIPLVFILSIIEEVPIYYNGGGLQGAATSLQHDLIMAVPVFVAIGIAIFLLKDKRDFTKGEVFFISALIGIFVEIHGGLLLATAGSFYYASMMSIGLWPSTSSHSNGKTLINIILGVIVCFIFVIIGAIFADNLYRAL